MIHRFVPVALVLALVVGVASGCTPEPAPTPSATGFASEEEAFAAAEETYRAYVDALNQVDLSDPETFEAVYAWTTGDANAEARETFSQMNADGWTVSGSSTPAIVEPRVWGGPDTAIELSVCLDVSAVDVIDETGKSVVSDDRGAVQSMLVTMTSSSSTDTGWLISTIEGRGGEPLCE